MTRRQHIALLIATHVLAVTVGAAAIYFLLMRDAARGMFALGEISVAAMHEMHVSMARDLGSDEEYEKALRDYLSIMDRLDAASVSPEDRSSMLVSRMSTYGRLALMAERRGANAEAAELMKSAAVACGGAELPRCSPEKIREIAVYFDKGRASKPK